MIRKERIDPTAISDYASPAILVLAILVEFTKSIRSVFFKTLCLRLRNYLTMATATLSFQALADCIQQQEAQLAKLRQELESRQTHLSDLTRRKGELQAELQRVEREIVEFAPSNMAGGLSSTSVKSAKPASASAAPKPKQGLSLPKYLVELVAKSKRPITAKELSDQVVANRFPTTSNNIKDIVQTRVYDLLRKGILVRVDGSSSVILANGFGAAKPGATKALTRVAKENNRKPTAAAPVGPANKQTLPQVIVKVLSASSRPLTGQELADRVKKSGYQSKSKDFRNVIWVCIGKMDGIERVVGKGFQLQKRKNIGSSKKS